MSRQDIRQKGGKVRERLGLASSRVARQVGFERFMTDFTYGAIWGRPGLALPYRALVSLSCVATQGRLEELRGLIPAALDAGLDPRALVETIIHAGLYGGFNSAERALEIADEIFESRGIEIPEEAPGDQDLEALRARGERFILEVHGEAAQSGYASPDQPITFELYQLAIQALYGDLWLREGLTRKERFYCALACFGSLGLESQLRKFSASALRIGLDRDEIREVLIQTAPYAGFARALNSLAVFSDVASKAET